MADEETPAKGEEGSKKEPEKPEEPEVPKGAENPDAVKSALQAERKAARAATKERDALAAKVKELEDRDKSELEKAQGRVSELEKTAAEHDSVVQKLQVKIAVMQGAAKAGISDPDAAAKLLDSSAIEFEDGQPKNIDQLLEGLVDEKPYLKSGAGKPQGDGDGGKGEGGGGRSFDDLVRGQYAGH